MIKLIKRNRLFSVNIILVISLVLLQIMIGISTVSLPITGIIVGLISFIALFMLSIRNPLWSLSLLIILLPFSSISVFNIGTIDFRPIDPFAISTFFALILNGVANKNLRLEKSFIDFPLLLLMMWLCFSIIWSIAPFTSLLMVTKIIYGVILFYIIVTLIKDEESLRFVLRAWYVMAFLLAVMGVFEFITEGIPRSQSYGFGAVSHWGHPVRTAGFEEGPDRMGFTMNIAIMVFLPFLLVQRSFLKLCFFVAALMCMFLVTVTTLSRASWMSLTAGLSFFIWASKRFRTILPILLLLGVGSFFLFVEKSYIWVFLQRFQTLFMPVAQAIPNRVSNWVAGLQILTTSPLIGMGGGTFPVIKGNAPHNLTVELLTGIGLIGYLLFLFLIVTIIWTLVKTLKAGGLEEWERLSVVGFLGGMVLYLVQSNFTSFRLKEYEMWSFLGLVIASLRIFSQKRKSKGSGKDGSDCKL